MKDEVEGLSRHKSGGKSTGVDGNMTTTPAIRQARSLASGFNRDHGLESLDGTSGDLVLLSAADGDDDMQTLRAGPRRIKKLKRKWCPAWAWQAAAMGGQLRAHDDPQSQRGGPGRDRGDHRG